MAINHLSPEHEQARPPITELPDVLIVSSDKSIDYYCSAEALLRDRLFAASESGVLTSTELAAIAHHWRLRDLLKRELHIDDSDQQLIRFASTCLRKTNADYDRVRMTAHGISNTDTLNYFVGECDNWFDYNTGARLPRRFRGVVPGRYQPSPDAIISFAHLAAATRFGLAVTSGRVQILDHEERYPTSSEHYRMLDYLDESIRRFTFSLIAHDKPGLAIAFGNIVSDPYENNWDGQFVSHLAYELIALRDQGHEDKYNNLHRYSMQTLSPIKRDLMCALLPEERSEPTFRDEVFFGPTPTDQVA